MTTVIRTSTTIENPLAGWILPGLGVTPMFRWAARTVDPAALDSVPDATGHGITARVRTSPASASLVDTPAGRGLLIRGSYASGQYTYSLSVPDSFTTVGVVADVTVYGAIWEIGQIRVGRSGDQWFMVRGSHTITVPATTGTAVVVAVSDGANSSLTVNGRRVEGDLSEPGRNFGNTFGGINGTITWFDFAVIPEAITPAQIDAVTAAARKAYPGLGL